MKPTTLGAVDVAAVLMTSGLVRTLPRLNDAEYALPSCGWLLDSFYPWFRSFLQAFGVLEYRAEAGDCDDYAALYAALARLCHRRMAGSTGTGLAVGYMHYLTANGTSHAVVVAITSDRGPVFIEPQTGLTVSLSDAERASAWKVDL